MVFFSFLDMRIFLYFIHTYFSALVTLREAGRTQCKSQNKLRQDTHFSENTDICPLGICCKTDDNYSMNCDSTKSWHSNVYSLGLSSDGSSLVKVTKLCKSTLWLHRRHLPWFSTFFISSLEQNNRIYVKAFLYVQFSENVKCALFSYLDSGDMS